ncbi:hypothetical protein M9H77_27948 [Catharanthus roseus]|uniref:Uncharacterized protein n=1 Tax=Catharanthus roseus TaxID=4058 RepID=A0ACC0AE57_CATRO|nr:hypothetical protein M9H77_27948 [Catharanthus roseus]
MSYNKDDIGNVDNDMVQVSHVRKIKKDAYYMTSSDGPGLIITMVKLKENDKDNNYEEWAKIMQLALHSKKNWDLSMEQFPFQKTIQTKRKNGEKSRLWNKLEPAVLEVLEGGSTTFNRAPDINIFKYTGTNDKLKINSIQRCYITPRVEHSSRDMFEIYPRIATRLSLRVNGKVIAVDTILPLNPDNSSSTKHMTQVDIFTLASYHPAIEVIRKVCVGYDSWVMEFYK